MGKSTFEADRQGLIDRYLAGAPREGEKSDKDSGEAVLTLILETERLRHGVTQPGEDRDRRDAETIAALQNSLKLGPEHSIAEAAFRRLVPAPEAAAGYVDAYVDSAEDRGSRKLLKRNAPEHGTASRGRLTGIV